VTKRHLGMEVNLVLGIWGHTWCTGLLRVKRTTIVCLMLALFVALVSEDGTSPLVTRVSRRVEYAEYSLSRLMGRLVLFFV
jgi:hypothetical protein